MGLWILEPKSGEPVPGTVHLQADADRHLRNMAHLKTGTGRHAGLVLAPQPSDSPNDPLNWSQAQKWYTSIFLSIGTGLFVGSLNFVNPANALMAKLFHTSISKISQSVSLILLTLGISAFITSPLARIWGKRPVILISNIIAMVGYVIVVARQDSLAALYAGRAIHGFGIAGIEYLVSSTVGDLFFVHERGVHLALWHYALSGGNAIGQVIGAQIVAAQSWVWPFIYYLIVTAVYTVIYYFTCPETTYIRSSSLDIDIREDLASDSSSSSISDAAPPSEKAPAGVASKTLAGSVEPEKRDPEPARGVSEEKMSYWQSLRVFNGRYSDESLLRCLTTPWTAFLLPAVSWAAYSYGCSVAFSASFSAAMSQIFTKPPYLFTTQQVGLTVLSAFVGATLGNIVPGPLSDWLVTYLSRRNHGVYEPEFRVVLAVPSLFLGLMGFWGFGLSLEAKAPWIVPVFFFGLATFAGSIQSLISNSYLLDCHRAQAQDGYAAVTIARGVFSFAMTFVINDWISRDGYRVVYFWIGTLHGISCIMGIFLYVFGKRIRLAVSKSHFIQSKLGSTTGVRTY